MAGISSKAFGSIENRYKFNSGTEFNKDFGLDHYETPFRSYDPQIGRFFQIDPLAENGHNTSSYAFCYGNPILFSDPFGLDTIRNFVSAGSFNDGDVFIYGGNTFVYNGELGIWARMDLLKEVVVTSNPRSNQPPLWNSWLMAFEGAREEYMRSAEEEAERQRLEESRKVSAAEAARLEANTEAMRRGQQVGEQYQEQNWGNYVVRLNDFLSPGEVPLWGIEYTLGKALANSDANDYIRPFNEKRMLDAYPHLKSRPVPVHLPVVQRRVDIPRNYVKGAGRVLQRVGIVSSVTSGITDINRFNRGEISGAHLTVNLIMNGVGFLGPWGAGISIVYGLVEDHIW